MARLRSKIKSTLIPTNLCIKWGLYHVRRYRDKTHKVVSVDKQVMIEGSSVNRIDMDRLRGGIKALDPKYTGGSTWPKKVEFELTISNLWDDDPDLTVDEDLKAIIIDYHINDGE
jgi:hypothetical protein